MKAVDEMAGGGKKPGAHAWARLPVMSRVEAERAGYVSITTVFDPTAEPDVVKSMERSMRGVDAVWIVQTDDFRTVCELGRKRGELTEG